MKHYVPFHREDSYMNKLLKQMSVDLQLINYSMATVWVVKAPE